MQKRLEIFHELVYYVFDSLLIPLIRSNFYVTGSNAHRNRLFFFRHDIWRKIIEPELSALKCRMFEEIGTKEAQKILDNRQLGFSHVRLLPKTSGVRPIMNLRRRTLRKGHKSLLGSSINTVLGPVYQMLTYEKVRQSIRRNALMLSMLNALDTLNAPMLIITCRKETQRHLGRRWIQ
jgi:telomerase reverse transcriptase